MTQLNFNPSIDIPSLSGKSILVTGGTAGLGRETVLAFAAHEPAHIYFSGRSEKSAAGLLSEVKSKYPQTPVTFLQCDLASLASVQEAAKDFLSKADRLDILMANAGIMALPPGLTQDGYEVQFGTNHMGHALLAKLLLPVMEATAEQTGDVRIVWNTSRGYMLHRSGGIDFDLVKTARGTDAPVMGHWYRYGQSKLANLLYARVVAKHHPSITSVSIHPGVSATGLVNSLGFWDRWFVQATNIGNMVTPEQCAWNQQWAAVAPLGSGERKLESGLYYDPVGVKVTPRGEGNNEELAEKLWEWTQDELKNWSL